MCVDISFTACRARFIYLVAIGLYTLTSFPIPVGAQGMNMGSQSTTQANASDETKALQDQITELKTQIAKLQAAQHANAKSGAAPKGMSKSNPMSMEGRDGSEMSGMGSMSSKTTHGSMDAMSEKHGNGSMRKNAGAMSASKGGCCGMSSMGKPANSDSTSRSDSPMKGMSADASGTPHTASSAMSGGSMPSLLHLGADDFFLDHADQIGLSNDQKASLAHVKAGAMARKNSSQETIDAAEAELWRMTGANQPNTLEIDRKVQQIAKMRADQQSAYIHAVSDAAKQLTPEQKEALLHGEGK